MFIGTVFWDPESLQLQTTQNSCQQPQLNTESAEDFSRTVKHLAQVAVRNRMKACYTIERLKQNDSKSFFSSDDEGL